VGKKGGDASDEDAKNEREGKGRSQGGTTPEGTLSQQCCEKDLGGEAKKKKDSWFTAREPEARSVGNNVTA